MNLHEVTENHTETEPAKHTVYLMDGSEIGAPYVSFTETGVRIYPNYPDLSGHTFVPYYGVTKVVTL